MQDMNRLGKNIQSLRKAFGESQSEFGDAIGLHKNTVSFYETGNREPSKDTITAIAQHFMVSVDELLNSDFSNIGKIDYDFDWFWKNVDKIFPLISSKRAKENKNYEKALSLHKELYSKFQQLSLYDIECFDIDKVFVCIEEYMKSYEDELAKEASAANVLALWYILLMGIKLFSNLTIYQSAFVKQEKEKNKLFEDKFEAPDQASVKEAQDLLNEFNTSDEKKKIAQMKILLKRSSSRRLSDLADYYLALQYLVDIVDNDLSATFNQRIGVEMMNAFMSVGNKYAKRLMMQCVSLFKE